MLGVETSNIVSTCTESRMIKLIDETTLGFVIDDIDVNDADFLTKVLLYNFGGEKAMTSASVHKPQCSFIITMNEDTLKKLSRKHVK